MEPTQMPINDRLDKKKVVPIHHAILCSHKKDPVFCRDMDGAGNHYPHQTNTGTENQTLYVLTNKLEFNNENTGHREGNITYITHQACWWEGGKGKESIRTNT